MVEPHSSPRAASLPPRAFFRQPLAIGLSALVGLSLAFAIWAVASRSSMRSQLESEQSQRAEFARRLDDLQSRVSSAELVNTRIEQAKEQLAQFEADRKAAEEQLIRAQQELQAAQSRLAELETQRMQLQARNVEHEKSIKEIEERRNALAAELAELDKSLSARSSEVADVGKRLLAARNDEAQLRSTIGQLNKEAATRADQAASAERRIQEARKVEAQAQEQLSFVRTQLAELEQRLEALTREFGKRSEEINPKSRGEGRDLEQPAVGPDRALPPPGAEPLEERTAPQ